MPDSEIVLDNRQARRLWLYLQGMLESPHNASSTHRAIDTVRQLGMVQLDSIANASRAHHHILWSRHPAYRPDDYNTMLGSAPLAFEHFSHDAVILPMEIYPFWQCQRQRRDNQYKGGAWGKNLPGKKVHNQILSTIEANGPMCSRDFASIFTQRADKSQHAWMRPPHKLALDYLWMKGELCVSHREGFIKYYDLRDRIIPSHLREMTHPHSAQIDFLCRSALQRLGFATAAEIQKFYDACELSDVRQWLAHKASSIRRVTVQSCEGDGVPMVALDDIDSIVTTLPEPARRLRIVNPFDPIARDRARLKLLFGMDFRIEIYTPASKRQYGYYVYPILEGDRFTARIDLRANRDTDTLEVRAWWLEPGTRHSDHRVKRLQSELVRLARLAGVKNISNVPAPSLQ